MNKTPDLLDSFEYNGHVDVEWFDVTSKSDIPDLPWQQVYIIGNLNNRVPVVVYETGVRNLPGGKTETGETVEDTVQREVLEELNMRVISWEPLGYQKLTPKNNPEQVYQLRLYVELESLGTFVNDPGGSVIGNELVSLENINSVINYGVVGERMVSLVKRHFK